MGVDANSFRAGMRRLAASVTVLTTRTADGGEVGLTATAVCSVSADPPVLLCCMNKANASFAAFCDAGHFAVNVLPAGAHDIATRFATSMSHAERFSGLDWCHSAVGSPLIAGSLAIFDCKLIEHADIGSHRIFFGEVSDVHLAELEQSPLLYAFGAYGSFESATANP